MNYLEIGFQEIKNLTDKHKKTLIERSFQKKFYSEHHKLLDTKYIVHHQEFVEFKGELELKGWGKKLGIFIQAGGKKLPIGVRRNLITMRKTEV